MVVRHVHVSLAFALVANITNGPGGRASSQASAFASSGISPRRRRRSPCSPRPPLWYEASRPLRRDGVRLSSAGNFYEDFQDFGDLGANDGGGGGGVDLSSLQSRVGQVKGAEASYDAKLARNWRRGNWSVRGFALDGRSRAASSGSAADAVEEDTVDISVVVASSSASFTDSSVPQDRALPRDRAVAVGRTDGSVFVVRLGDQYLTTFREVPRIVDKQRQIEGEVEGDDGAGMAMRMQNEWIDANDARGQRQDEQLRPSQSPIAGGGDQADRKPVPFEIICQFLTSRQGEPVNSLAYHDVLEEEGCGGIICAGTGNSGEISVWKLPSSGNEGQAVQALSLGGVHEDRIVSLEVMVLGHQGGDAAEPNILFSASRDGTFALWDLGRNGELMISCRCPDAVSLTCADVSNPTFSVDGYEDGNGEDVVLLGTSHGYVFGYYVRELLSSAASGDPKSEFPAPNLRFRAHGLDSGIGEAVTAIECGGEGTIPSSSRLRGSLGEGRPGSGGLGDSPSISSFILLTGGEDGSVKQWEILSQKFRSATSGARMEHWPRISSQRMRRRSHLFPPGHDGPVTSISQQGRIDSSKFLSCGRDGSLRVWSASSGEQLYAMDGFSSGISSLACLGRDLLVTDGMGGYVCVHDFGIEEDAASDGYDLEW